MINKTIRFNLHGLNPIQLIITSMRNAFLPYIYININDVLEISV